MDELGVTLDNVVRMVIDLTHMADRDAVDCVHGRAFATAWPAFSGVQVADLTPAAAKVEIEATAVIAGSG